MLSKLKTYAMIALGAVTAFALFMWQFTRANFKAAELKGEKAAREVENKSSDAMIGGLENEEKIKNDATTDRKSFLD
jgi:hypothetical protein